MRREKVKGGKGYCNNSAFILRCRHGIGRSHCCMLFPSCLDPPCSSSSPSYVSIYIHYIYTYMYVHATLSILVPPPTPFLLFKQNYFCFHLIFPPLQHNLSSSQILALYSNLYLSKILLLMFFDVT